MSGPNGENAVPSSASTAPGRRVPSTRTRAVRITGAAGLADPAHASWTNGFIVGNEIVLSGMTAHPAASDPSRPLSTYEQTRIVLDRIKALLEAAGASIANITKLVVYVTDIADKDAVGRARKEYFADLGAFPASTLVAVEALVFPALTVEIDAQARKDFDLRDLAASTAMALSRPTP